MELVFLSCRSTDLSQKTFMDCAINGLGMIHYVAWKGPKITNGLGRV